MTTRTTRRLPLALLAATTLLLTACGDGDTSTTGGAPSAPAPASRPSTTPVADVAPPTDAELIASGRQAATNLGAGAPVRVRLWRAPLDRIARAVAPGQPRAAKEMGHRPAVLVVLEGDFDLEDAPHPPDSEAPRAAAVAWAADARTGQTIAVSALPRLPPTLAELGRPDVSRAPAGTR